MLHLIYLDFDSNIYPVVPSALSFSITLEVWRSIEAAQRSKALDDW